MFTGLSLLIVDRWWLIVFFFLLFFFLEKYDYVGRLLKPGDEPSEYTDEEDIKDHLKHDWAVPLTQPKPRAPETAATGRPYPPELPHPVPAINSPPSNRSWICPELWAVVKQKKTRSSKSSLIINWQTANKTLQRGSKQMSGTGQWAHHRKPT